MDDINVSVSNPNEGIREMNFFQRASGIILSPAETMKNLAQKPRILFPILAAIFGVAAFYLIRFPLYEEFLMKTLETGMAQKNIQLTPEQLQTTYDMSKVIGLVTTPITTAFFWILSTAVIFGLTKLFKGQGSFKQMLSVTGYAYTIMLVYYIISIIVSFFSGQLMFDNSLANISNIFAPDMKGTFIYGILRGIDLFSIWYYTVMAIGVYAVTGLSKAKSYSIVYAIYIAMMLLSVNAYKNM